MQLTQEVWDEIVEAHMASPYSSDEFWASRGLVKSWLDAAKNRVNELVQELKQVEYTRLASRLESLFHKHTFYTKNKHGINFTKREELILHLSRTIAYCTKAVEQRQRVADERDKNLIMELTKILDKLQVAQRTALFGANNFNTMGIQVTLKMQLPLVWCTQCRSADGPIVCR